MYQRTVLPNGIRVISEYIPYVRSISLGVWFETGGRDECPDEQGFSHFIEHLVFKGSAKYSARQIAELMDTSGGHLNAFTAKEHSCFYARVLDEHFDLATDILQEMLLRPLLSEQDLDRERSVVLEEIKMYEDTPDELVHDLLAEALWPDHALGRSILGMKDNILQVCRQDLLGFMSKFYCADRMVIVAVGNVDHQRVVDEFAGAFSVLNPSAPISASADIIATGAAKKDRLIRPKDTEQVHLCVGGPALSRRDPRKYALYILETIAGGGMSSRLFQELREERGLVYSTYAYHSSYRDTGNFGVYAGCSPEYIRDVLAIIQAKLTELGQEQIHCEELERAKAQLKGNLLLSLESTTNRMARLAKGEMNYRRIQTPEEVIGDLEKVTLEDVRCLAEEIYQPQRWSVVGVGPIDYDDLA